MSPILASGILVPLGVRLTVHPERLASTRIDCYDIPPPAGDRIQDPIDVDGGDVEAGRRIGAEVVAPPGPRDLKRFEVLGVDLIERGIPRGTRIATPVAPLSFGVSFGDLGRGRDETQGDETESENEPRYSLAGESRSLLLRHAHVFTPVEGSDRLRRHCTLRLRRNTVEGQYVGLSGTSEGRSLIGILGMGRLSGEIGREEGVRGFSRDRRSLSTPGSGRCGNSPPGFASGSGRA